jgi:hypothetical protein
VRALEPGLVQEQEQVWELVPELEWVLAQGLESVQERELAMRPVKALAQEPVQGPARVLPCGRSHFRCRCRFRCWHCSSLPAWIRSWLHRRSPEWTMKNRLLHHMQ